MGRPELVRLGFGPQPSDGVTPIRLEGDWLDRFELLIKRRKGERTIDIDWHQAARLMELPPCDWGAGVGRARLVCDERLHLTDVAGQAPCTGCGKPWCRACHAACPRCKRPARPASD